MIYSFALYLLCYKELLLGPEYMTLGVDFGFSIKEDPDMFI